jgi:hypothetical protein
MALMTFEAYWGLIEFDIYLKRRDFPVLHEQVRSQPVRLDFKPSRSIEEICLAVDMACIWYWKEVLCLQRSAATTCLLKRYGVAAQMVIGTRQMPFKAHAWVEVDGRVVNDKPYIGETYAVIDRC